MGVWEEPAEGEAEAGVVGGGGGGVEGEAEAEGMGRYTRTASLIHRIYYYNN